MVAGNALSRGVFVVAAKRTPFGTFGGSLKSHTPTDLSVIASNAAIKASGLSPENISSVCIGNVLSASAPDAPYLARHVALKCGLPVPTPALIVNRLCGSGFQSIVNGVQEILVGDSQVVLTGGTDSMSACPYAVRDIRFGTRLGSDPKLEECDAFALRSQQTWGEAAAAGHFTEETAPIMLKIKKKDVEMTLDEHPKPKTTLEGLAKLPPVFKKGGVVTAGGASGICDGAAAVMLASEEAVTKLGLNPLARLVGYGVAGCEPTIMGIGPVPAINAMLEVSGISMGEVDQIEINEAFAAQALACQKALDIPLEKFNTCGGAVALGHPLAASGSRISAHLVHKLRREGQKYGIGAACIGGGQGIAILLEKM